MDYESPDSLYDLLPAVYRIRDAEYGYQLRALLRIIAKQVRVTKEDIDRLYDNLFIETCDDWVIPYIGDLVANNPLYEIGRNRADVAKTIHYRRRKGTLPMLEEMASDVTGWGCRAVEFFERLDWSQNLNHLRPDCYGCADVRNLNTMALVNSAFDATSHELDVRSISQSEGWHNVKNVGFFLWRLRSYPLESVPAAEIKDGSKNTLGWTFSPLGNSAPLFTCPLLKRAETGLADETNVAGPIRRLAFHDDHSKAGGVFYGEPGEGTHRIYVVQDDTPVTPDQLVCMDLEKWRRPENGRVGIDVGRGRLTFPDGKDPDRVMVSFNYGFSTDIGGGPYRRPHSVTEDTPGIQFIPVTKDGPTKTLQDGLSQWNQKGKPDCLIQIQDNQIYGGMLPTIDLPEDGLLVIEAKDYWRPDVRLLNNIVVTAQKGGQVTLNGLLIEGGVKVSGNDLTLTVTHCTLVPGAGLDEAGIATNPKSPSLFVDDSASSGLEVLIDHSITGPVQMPEDCGHLTIEDSIVDAPEVNGTRMPAIADDFGKPGPAVTILRSTALGEVHVRELTLASEVIFTKETDVERLQSGCVRFSYFPARSKVPRQFQCLSDPPPAFTSVHYGHPAYCQLSLNCPNEIRTGAEDGAEMGVFSSLKNPQRAANLRIRLEEYLPFGLKPGFIYVT